MLRHVDLCSGIGGFALGFQWAELSKTIMFCDTEKWCREILAKNFPNVPITNDVKELANDPERLVPDHDILTAGYPCQPFSIAGRQKGEKDDRHIWPYIFRIIACKRPTWCVFENVYGHVALGLDKVLADLESEGYSTRTFIVPACGKDAPHRRDRLWIIARIVADTESGGRGRNGDLDETQGSSQSDATQSDSFGGISSRPDDVADSDSESSRGRGFSKQIDGQKRRISETGRKSVQSRDRATCAGNIEQSRQDVADTTFLGLQEHGHSKSGKSVEGSQNVADTDSDDERGREKSRQSEGDTSRERTGDGSFDVADSDDEGSQGGIHRGENSERQSFDGHSGRSRSTHRQPEQDFWAVEPDVGRVAHGIPRRVDRLKGLGNAIVPQISMQIGLAIKEHLDD